MKSNDKKSVKKVSVLLTSLEKAVITHYVITKHPSYKEKSLEFIKDKYDDIETAYKDITEEFLINDVPFSKPEKESFTFIDLFAGIGGFRMALQKLGGKCLFSSEYDKFAQHTYFANYGEMPFGDITNDDVKKFIPQKFDVICGGFPCQPFSLAGVSKKNSLGRLHGFDDVKQGNLFFHVAEIIKTHRPKAFFLENVKNLVSHDKGNTFKVIKQTLIDLGYSFDFKVINGKSFVPQNRERTFMIGFDKSIYGENINFDFNDVVIPEVKQSMRTILQPEVNAKYTLSDKLWNYLQGYAVKHKEKGNGFGFGLVDLDGTSRTISARYYKDGAEILIPQDGINPRRLTPLEAGALQGYPVYPINTNDKHNSLRIPVSDNQAYKQFGNSVVMPLINAIGAPLIKKIKKK